MGRIGAPELIYKPQLNGCPANPLTDSPGLPSLPPTSMSVENSARTSSCPVVPPCTKVWLTDSSRSSSTEPPPVPKSESLLPPTVNTPSGREDLPSLLSPPSPLLGSPRKTTRSTVPLSSTENVTESLPLGYSYPKMLSFLK